jgi:hypothetical protein
MHFVIVTPVRNCSRFVDETVLSVISQAGPFSIRYHVQDGGSTDGTLDKLACWADRLAGNFPILCDGITFSYASEPDRGMYDAISRGFAVCRDGDAMGWLNADDCLASDALATVTAILTRFPEVDWLCGRTCLTDEMGKITRLDPAHRWPRAAIAAGLFDFRTQPFLTFLQQEGMFWRPSLWRRSGGLDTSFLLAGDFDLWRRFAQHSDLVTVDAVLGSHRCHSAQLTVDLTKYYAEIDARMGGSAKCRQREFTRLNSRPPKRTGPLIARDQSGEWAYVPVPTFRSIWDLRRLLPKSLSVRHLLSGRH